MITIPAPAYLSACPSFLRMQSCVFFILCILAFASPQDAGHRSHSAVSSPARSQETSLSRTESNGRVPTSFITHRGHNATSSPTRRKMSTSHTIVSKSSGKAPTVYRKMPTSSPKTTFRPTISKSSGKVPTISSPKTTFRPTIRTTSQQKSKSASSRRSYSEPSRTQNSSPPPATTTSNPTTTRKPTIIPSASKKLTVSNGQTVSAQVGWMVVGVGIGGAVAVGDTILPVAGGTEAIIEESSSGQDELSTVESDTSTTTSRSSSSSRSRTSSSSSSIASPTPYNIYPRLDSTPRQQSAFAQHLAQIARPGSVRRITGVRDRLLLWVASLTPAQASELSRDPVVSSLPRAMNILPLNVLSRSEVLMWISYCRLIWKQRMQARLLHRQTVLPRTARIDSESVMDPF